MRSGGLRGEEGERGDLEKLGKMDWTRKPECDSERERERAGGAVKVKR